MQHRASPQVDLPLEQPEDERVLVGGLLDVGGVVNGGLLETARREAAHALLVRRQRDVLLRVDCMALAEELRRPAQPERQRQPALIRRHEAPDRVAVAQSDLKRRDERRAERAPREAVQSHVLHRALRHAVHLVLLAERLEVVPVDGHVLEHRLGRRERAEDLGDNHVKFLVSELARTRLDESYLVLLAARVDVAQRRLGERHHRIIDVDACHVFRAMNHAQRRKHARTDADVEHARLASLLGDELGDAPTDGLTILLVAVLVVEHGEEVLGEAILRWLVVGAAGTFRH